MILEGAASKKAKKGLWPSQVVVTLRNATFECGGTGPQVMRTYTKTLSEYPMAVESFGNAKHPGKPSFELNQEYGGGEYSIEPENPGAGIRSVLRRRIQPERQVRPRLGHLRLHHQRLRNRQHLTRTRLFDPGQLQTEAEVTTTRIGPGRGRFILIGDGSALVEGRLPRGR
jgi:hypothetical protein